MTVAPPVLGAEITAEALSFTATGAVLRETTPTSWAKIRPEDPTTPGAPLWQERSTNTEYLSPAGAL